MTKKESTLWILRPYKIIQDTKIVHKKIPTETQSMENHVSQKR
jgi:hypothetical protein